ncbi:hypothetical protein NDU88_007351 [Pleurodeles waltl]|uniref:Uncharacterized protein n=1 Tax=Pleurodeles waltl TaxID=8319 RepID=A0AAV7VSL1_PLEWA|nr:hypothetical protein NDU88_007351 [Pleurodeles waltl]
MGGRSNQVLTCSQSSEPESLADLVHSRTSVLRESARFLAMAEEEPAHGPGPHATEPRLQVCGPAARRSFHSALSSVGVQSDATTSSGGPGQKKGRCLPRGELKVS